jgi:hypothetical protein
VTCPADIRVTATSAAGAIVTFDLPSGTDAVSPVTVTASPPSGSTFAVGAAPVKVMAKDASGNAAECTFQVLVDPPPAPGEDGGVGAPREDGGVGAPREDGGVGAPGEDGAPTEDPAASDGCGCRESPGRSTTSSFMLVVGLAAWIGRRRRRTALGAAEVRR